jgi:hypothetical protein
LGTADRCWSRSAGMVGFLTPSDPEPAKKLRHLRWSPKFLQQGWIGGHSSVASPRFVWRTLVPWIHEAEAEPEQASAQGK